MSRRNDGDGKNQIVPPPPPPQPLDGLDISVRDLGAVGDGISDDTKYFEQAIATIERHGGGRLIVSGQGTGGSNYLIRPINLTSHLIFYVDRHVNITAVADARVWPLLPALPSYGQGRDHPGPRYTSMIHGEYLVNVTIQGADRKTSIIDGNGPYWWDLRRHKLDTFTRGHLVEFLYCRNITMKNIRLKDSPFWTNHFYASDQIVVRNVDVVAPDHGAFNTDGWDPDSSSNVLIEDSTYSGGDDCVAIKSGWDCFGQAFGRPSVNITLRNLTCHGHSASIAIGSEMSGGVENVWVENIVFTKANQAAKLKTGNTRGGHVRNITYHNITVQGEVDSAIRIDMYHFHNTPNPACPDNYRAMPQIDNINFSHFDGRDATILSHETFHFVGLPENPIRNVSLSNVYFPPPSSQPNDSVPVVPWNCSQVHGVVQVDSVRPWPPCREFDIVRPSSTPTTRGLSPWVLVATTGMLLLALLTTLALVRWFRRVAQPQQRPKPHYAAVLATPSPPLSCSTLEQESAEEDPPSPCRD